MVSSNVGPAFDWRSATTCFGAAFSETEGNDVKSALTCLPWGP